MLRKLILTVGAIVLGFALSKPVQAEAGGWGRGKDKGKGKGKKTGWSRVWGWSGGGDEAEGD